MATSEQTDTSHIELDGRSIRRVPTTLPSTLDSSNTTKQSENDQNEPFETETPDVEGIEGDDATPFGDTKQQTSQTNDNPGSESATIGNNEGNTSTEDIKKAKRMKIFVVSSIALLIITIIIVILAVVLSENKRDNGSTKTESTPTTNPTISPTSNIFYNIAIGELPEPGIPFVYHDGNGTNLNLTLNSNVSYFDQSFHPKCIVEFDENGNLDSKMSYIEIEESETDSIQIGTILLAAGPLLIDLDLNCTLVPAIIITDIIQQQRMNQSIATLKFKCVLFP